MSQSETDPLLPKHPTDSRRNSSASRGDHADYVRLQRRGSTSTGSSRDANCHHGSDHSDSGHGDSDPDSAPLRAEDFYELIGMKVPEPHGKTPSNLEAAHGFYGQMCQKKRRIERKYRFYDLVVMFFLIMQLLLSAVFIVLGALNIDQHIAIAVLGAVSSIIAGVLALMRGQGLPNRLRMERDGLTKVILEADELYWDVGAGREITYEDVRKLRDAYSSVLEDAGRNHPDTWNTTAIATAQGLTKTGTPAKHGVSNVRHD